MNVGWLKKVLEKYPDENAELVVMIGSSYYPIGGKIDKIGIAFMDKEGKLRGYEIVALTISETPLAIDNLSVDEGGSLN